MFRGLRMFVGRPRGMSGRFLQVEARINPVPPDLVRIVAKMDEQERLSFYRALGLESAKTGVLSTWNNPNDVSVIKSLPITDQLTDAAILQALTDVYLSASVIWASVRFWLDPMRAAETRPTTEQIESPATKAETPPVAKEKKAGRKKN